MAFTGSLEKMLIEAYEDDAFAVSKKVGEVRLWINPEKYTRTYSVCLNDRSAQGSPAGSPDFNKIPSEVMKLELVFDGTGVIPSPIPGIVPFTDDGISKQVKEFTTLVCGFDSEMHSTRFLWLRWGSLTFRCRLQDLSLTYTLFKPDGTPLRARGDATFVEYTSEMQKAKEANLLSPDMTRIVTVRAGDTLPLLCWQVYGSSAWYLRVAQANALDGFRQLVPGTQLIFPPLEDAA